MIFDILPQTPGLKPKRGPWCILLEKEGRLELVTGIASENGARLLGKQHAAAGKKFHGVCLTSKLKKCFAGKK